MILISGGCSFTEYPRKYENWPLHLSKKLNMEAFFLGVAGGDNSLIATKVMNQIALLLDNNVNVDELLVGVMWSGINRHHVYLEKKPISGPGINHKINGSHNIYIQSPHYEDKLSELYYEHFQDNIGSMISSIKNILLVQNFCKLNNIKYFFSEYSADVVRNSDLKNHVDVGPLYNLIDHSYFLPVKHMRDWCLNESGLEYINPNDDHPTTEMSEKFTDEIIIPFLKKLNYI